MNNTAGSNDNRPAPDSHWGMRFLQWLARVALFLPWIWLALFALFVLATTLYAGQLPSYGAPDPKQAGAATLLYYPTLILLLTVMATIPIGVGLAMVKLLRDVPDFYSKREAVLYLAGIGVLLVVTISDLGGLMTWLGD
jgi:hypothetical protein